MYTQPVNSNQARPVNKKGIGLLVAVIAVIAVLLMLFGLCTVQVPTGNTFAG